MGSLTRWTPAGADSARRFIETRRGGLLGYADLSPGVPGLLWSPTGLLRVEFFKKSMA